MSGKPEWIKDELTEGGEEEPQVHEEVRTPLKATTPAPSVSIIKTPEDVPAALERVAGRNIDLDWLMRRAGKKGKK